MNRKQLVGERLAARYPIVHLVTPDERDAVRLLQQAADEAGLQVQVMTYGTGDPAALALDALAGLRTAESPRLVVLPLAELLLSDHRVVRVIAEAMTELERAGHVLALVGPQPVPCPALERDRVVLHLPLPAAAELQPLVHAALPGQEGEGRAAAVRALQGLTLAQARRALRRVRALPVERQVGELQAEKRDLVATAGGLEVIDEVPALADVGGLDLLKAWLGRRKLALQDEARRFGLPVPRGVLVVGVQGCGKTLICKATAAVLGLPLVRLDVARLYTADHAPEAHLLHALQVAEAMAPVVLWIDEIDKAFAHVAGSGGSESGARVFGSLLTWLGEQQRGVFVAATANRIAHLPAELVRKGRFDETFFVDLPDQAVRAEILAIALRKSGRDPQRYDLERLSKAADRLTGAEIAEAVTEALGVAYALRRDLSDADVAEALSKVVPFVETYEPQVRELRDWARRRCRPAVRDRSLHELFTAAQEESGLRRPQRTDR